MDGIRASMDTIEDGVARMVIYRDDERIRSVTWNPDDLPDSVDPGSEFEVTFEDDDIASEVVGVSYSQTMTEQLSRERRIPTVEHLAVRGAPESQIREYLQSSGASEEEIEHIIDEYGDEYDD